MDIIKTQKDICDKYGSPYHESPQFLKVGVSINLKDGMYPIHGLRHPPQDDTTGWYIWVGEYSVDPDFFISLHVIHIKEWRPEILPYLGLSPSWRFLIASGYEDVWQDINLLNID